MNGRDKSTMNRGGIQLQHRHFVFIAAVLSELPDHAESLRAQKQSVINAFVAACRRSNSRFDEGRFIAACGGER
jgi:hypothetical protein